MDKAERLDWIRKARESADRIAALAVEAPEEAMDFRPPFPEAWTIREHLAHLADTETFVIGYRVRLALAQPGAAVVSHDAEAWRLKLRHDHRDPAEAVTTFIDAREESLRILEENIADDWSEAWYLHPQRGRTDLEGLLSLIAGHSDFHVPYIERNISAFRGEPEAQDEPTED